MQVVVVVAAASVAMNRYLDRLRCVHYIDVLLLLFWFFRMTQNKLFNLECCEVAPVAFFSYGLRLVIRYVGDATITVSCQWPQTFTTFSGAYLFLYFIIDFVVACAAHCFTTIKYSRIGINK